MIHSMTGFGRATRELPNKKVTVDVKSVNSKQLDLSVRTPHLYRDKEMELRGLLAQRIERGKVEFSLQIEVQAQDAAPAINTTLIESYYRQLKEISQRTGIPEPTDWYTILLRLPDVTCPEVKQVEEAEWNEVLACVDDAIAQFLAFRSQEGDSLKTLFLQKIANIGSLLEAIAPYEIERVEKVRERITESLAKLETIDYDRNRLEQEMIFYIEKLDINEEKQRLANHLSYFKETLNLKGGQGKKLGFILQEIGREINTLGSKSNHYEMQKIVVQMKDDLEQMKEQVLNVM